MIAYQALIPLLLFVTIWHFPCSVPLHNCFRTLNILVKSRAAGSPNLKALPRSLCVWRGVEQGGSAPRRQKGLSRASVSLKVYLGRSSYPATTEIRALGECPAGASRALAKPLLTFLDAPPPCSNPALPQNTEHPPTLNYEFQARGLGPEERAPTKLKTQSPN